MLRIILKLELFSIQQYHYWYNLSKIGVCRVSKWGGGRKRKVAKYLIICLKWCSSLFCLVWACLSEWMQLETWPISGRSLNTRNLMKLLKYCRDFYEIFLGEPTNPIIDWRKKSAPVVLLRSDDFVTLMLVIYPPPNY